MRPEEVDMPKTSKATASEHVVLEGHEGYLENLEGGYTAAFEKYTEDADLAALMTCLVNDQASRPTGGTCWLGK